MSTCTPICAELETVAARLSDDETPFVKTLRALAGLATEEASADDALASALTRLRAVDDKSYLAYALNSAANPLPPDGPHQPGAPLRQRSLDGCLGHAEA